MSPIAWLLTFCCYGSWLPGDPRGYIERGPGRVAYRAPPNPALHGWVAQQLPRSPFLLDAPARAVVTEAIRDQCLHAGWVLLAVHVRTNHLHVVLTGVAPPERMTNQLKAWATRRLRVAERIGGDVKPWAQGGSNVPLRTVEAVEAACRYVVEGQGAPLDESGPVSRQGRRPA